MQTFEIKRHVEYYEADTTGKLTVPMLSLIHISEPTRH